LGIAVANTIACGDSSSNNPPDASASSSGSSSSGSSSSSSSGGSSSSGSDSGGDDSGGGDDGGPILGNCPGSCPTVGTNCCLLNTDAGVLGACLTPTACASMGGGFVMCGNTPDTVDCTGDAGTTCCLAVSDAGGLPGSYCATSCPMGTPYACNTDQTTCPNMGTGYLCSQIPGSPVPVAALGECTVLEGGTGEGGAEGGADAAVDSGSPVDAGGQ
jgi:hypothetical protein